MSNQLWPSNQVSTTRATKSTYKPQAIKTDWAGGILTFMFLAILVAGILGGIYFFLLAPLFENLQAVSNVLPTSRH